MSEAIIMTETPTIEMCTCLRCGFKWFPRNLEKPRTCANQKCRSPYWDKPRVRKVKTKTDEE